MYCPKCGNENSDRSKFCVKCANPMAGGPDAFRHGRGRLGFVLSTVLPWILAVGLGAYILHFELGRDSAHKSVWGNTVAMQQQADAYSVAKLASAAEHAGQSPEAQALWAAVEKLANEAADAWLKVDNDIMAAGCRDLARTHALLVPAGQGQ